MGTESDLSLDQLIELERRAAEREAEQAAAAAAPPGDGDDALVLPWWQRPFNIGVLVVTAALLAGMVGWLIGDSGAQPKHGNVEAGFLQDMREHHQQAVEMSWIYRGKPNTNPGLQEVARTIIIGQNIEIGRMIQMLRDFGEPEYREGGTPMDWMAGEGGHTDHDGTMPPMGDPDDPFTQMPGMATEEQLDALNAATGRAADELFVELMTAHHQGGVEMARYAADHADNAEVVAMAEGIVHAQQGEIVEMENLLK